MKALLITLLISVFISFVGINSFTLFDVDEAVFAQATKEMVQSRDYITPTYNGENRYDKPILIYWLMAIAYKIFGINEFSARLPSAVAGVILTLSIFLFVKRLINERVALYAGVSFSLSLYYLVYTHAAVTDMVLTLFITLSLFSLFLAYRGDKRFIYGFYIFSALAFLTKGLIGIVFPFTVASLFIISTRGFRALPEYLNMKGVALFLLIALPWYLAQIVINGKEFIDYFFIKHHFTRYTGVISGHRGPLFYYIPVIILGFFPWIAYLPSSIKDVFENLKKLFREKLLPDSAEAQIKVFVFIWFSFIFIFFSFSKTKLPNYILPSIPALAILLSITLSKATQRDLKLSNFIILLLGIILGFAFIFSSKYLAKFGFDNDYFLYYMSAPMFTLSFISAVSIFTNRDFFGFKALVMAVFLITLIFKALPVANYYLQGNLYELSLSAKQLVSENQKVFVYRLNKPSIVFYSDRKVKRLNTKQEVEQLPKGTIVITKTKDLVNFRDLDIEILDERRDYAIFKR